MTTCSNAFVMKEQAVSAKKISKRIILKYKYVLYAALANIYFKYFFADVTNLLKQKQQQKYKLKLYNDIVVVLFSIAFL